MTKPVAFPKYEELSEEERRRLLDTVGQGILEAQSAGWGEMMGLTHAPSPSDFDPGWDTFTYLGPVDGADLEMENQVHVLNTEEREPGVHVHRIAYGRRVFARKH